jgi:hypothetical protein
MGETTALAMRDGPGILLNVFCTDQNIFSASEKKGHDTHSACILLLV